MRDHLIAASRPAAPAAIIDELRALEDLKCAAEARQARLAADLDRIRTVESTLQVGEERAAKPAVHAEIALARRVSPHRGRRLLSLARFLDREMPRTRAAFENGLITEWRAHVIATEICCLGAEHRDVVDQIIATDAEELSAKGDRQVQGEVRALAARLDAASVAARRRRAESERRVTIRPAPDTMVYFTALLPVAAGVGLYATLKVAADSAIGVGAATNHGNAMADELVRRIRGEAAAQPVALRLVMSDRAVFDPDGGHGNDSARLEHHGSIPAEAARALLADNVDAGAKIWLKRLYRCPGTGELIAMDSRARLFPTALGEFIDLRDQFCRTPWCGAPIRHRDHALAHAAGGPTSAANGQGLCADCNHTKEAPGWTSRPSHEPGRGHTVTVTTPTGHRHRSRAPVA